MRKYGFSTSAVVACCLPLSGCSDPECMTLGGDFRNAEYDPPGVVEIVGGIIGDGWKARVCCVEGKTGTVTVTSADESQKRTLRCHSQGITQV